MFVLSAGLIDYKSSFNNLVLIRHGFGTLWFLLRLPALSCAHTHTRAFTD